MMVINARIKKTLSRIANREDPDQTAFFRISDLGPCLRRLNLAGNKFSNFRTFTVIKK